LTSIPKIDRLIRSKRKTIAIIIELDSSLTIRAPFRVPEKLINEYVNEKRNWIIKKQENAKERQKHFIQMKFEAGESILFLGKLYKIEFNDSIPFPLILDSKLYVLKENKNIAEKLILSWYRQKAEKIISERVKYYSRVLNIQYKTVSITSARKRWGSCSRTRKLNFSFRLIMTPLEVLNYVVIHELAHIIEHNHSQNFWNLVKQYCPDYKTHLNWLKKNNYIAFIN
jgi:predicted metal-dependent hydrolase